jgi:hypothetical protein
MGFIRVAACASALLVPALLIAEQAPKAASGHAKRNGCHGFLISVANGQPVQTLCSDGRSLTSSQGARPMYAEKTPADGVVIYNGNQKQTKVFNASIDPSAPVHNLPPAVIAIVTAGSKSESTRPVVLGISSNALNTQPVVLNIASSGSSTEPVVIGVASSGFQTAGAVEPVAISISPRPAKRPPYRPAYLDQQ